MTDFAQLYAEYEVPLLIAMMGILTYLTRIGGYVFLSRFENIPRPVNAGLEAVPAAVIATLVVPPVFNAGPAEATALFVAFLACFRFQPIVVILIGQITLVALRQFGL